MKKRLITIQLLLCSFVFAQKPYWQQQVDFDIRVSLNDVQHTLDGFETITYMNNSPDTLWFIWLHLWPNAYKNEQTALGKQLLSRSNSSSFSFPEEKDCGYINQLDFKVEGMTAETETHAQYIDIIKLILPKPLAPGQKTQITTPFHVKIPKNFSRGGHIGQSYQITQWYPKPAVYDRFGWHPMPYLNQGEFYNDFGNYHVSITLPQKYKVAATGALQNEIEKTYLHDTGKTVASNFKYTTIHYKADNVTDFAWFADKHFIVQQDTMHLATNASIQIYAFVLPSQKVLWKNSIAFIKRAVRFYSDQLGDYPYSAISVVCAPPETSMGGMEYPTITLINASKSTEAQFDIVVAHEVGHNWLQGMLSTDERHYPWMDEGMNTYYERKYKSAYGKLAAQKIKKKNHFSIDQLDEVFLYYQINKKIDQPIATSSEDFTSRNYASIAYTKAALWMEKLEQTIGKEKMQQLMQTYFNQWKMKHPYPEDFKKIAETIADKNLDNLFELLRKKGNLSEEL